jgi:hypothetical protein
MEILSQNPYLEELPGCMIVSYWHQLNPRSSTAYSVSNMIKFTTSPTLAFEIRNARDYPGQSCLLQMSIAGILTHCLDNDDLSPESSPYDLDSPVVRSLRLDS